MRFPELTPEVIAKARQLDVNDPVFRKLHFPQPIEPESDDEDENDMDRYGDDDVEVDMGELVSRMRRLLVLIPMSRHHTGRGRE